MDSKEIKTKKNVNFKTYIEKEKEKISEDKNSNICIRNNIANNIYKKNVTSTNPLDAPCQHWLWFWPTSPHTELPILQLSLVPPPQIPVAVPPGPTCFQPAGEESCLPLPSPAESAPCRHKADHELVSQIKK